MADIKSDMATSAAREVGANGAELLGDEIAARVPSARAVAAVGSGSFRNILSRWWTIASNLGLD